MKQSFLIIIFLNRIKADIIIWDFATKQAHARLALHKVKVQDLAFSANDAFLYSLGGQDDGRFCHNLKFFFLF